MAPGDIYKLDAGVIYTRVGSIVIIDEDGENIHISMSHTPSDKIKIQRADRRDLLLALLQVEGIEAGVIELIDPHQMVSFDFGHRPGKRIP